MHKIAQPNLAIKVLVTRAAEDVLKYIYFFWKNKAWHIMLIVCLADDLQEMSNFIFLQD